MTTPASAQSPNRLRVTADQAVVWAPGFGWPIALATKGAEFEVRSRQGDWYEVAVPAPISGPRQFGFLAVPQAQMVRGRAPVAQPAPVGAARVTSRATQAATTILRRRPTWVGRGFVTFGGGQRLSSSGTTTSWKVPTYAEQSSYTATYSVKAAPVFGGGGAVRLVRNLGAYVAVSRFAGKQPAAIDLSVPHPFLFNTPRTATGEAPGLQRSELEIDVDAIWLAPLARKWELTVYGGAAFFSASQDIVSHVSYSDVYPYDSITFASASTERVSKTQLGFNAGVDVTYRLNRRFGVAGGVHTSRADTTFTRADGNGTDARLGGTDVTVSLRVRF